METTKSSKNIFYICKKYNKKNYPKYDNYDAINIDKVVDIPQDYTGAMGVPITIMDKVANDGYIHFRDDNEKELVFEIIGTIGAAGVFNVGKATVNGKDLFKRILIKRVK